MNYASNSIFIIENMSNIIFCYFCDDIILYTKGIKV